MHLVFEVSDDCWCYNVLLYSDLASPGIFRKTIMFASAVMLAIWDAIASSLNDVGFFSQQMFIFNTDIYGGTQETLKDEINEMQNRWYFVVCTWK